MQVNKIRVNIIVHTGIVYFVIKIAVYECELEHIQYDKE